MQLVDPPPSPRPMEPVAAPSWRVLQQLAALCAPGFCRCLHSAAAGMGISTTETGDAVRGGGVDDNNDGRALLLVELPWSGELLNRALAWGGNWLHRARGGRWISELHSSYPAGYPAGLDAE